MNLKEYFEKSPRGVAKKLAETLEISPSYLSQLAADTAPMPPQLAVKIEQATEGQVTRKDLYPDDWHLIWPELIDQDDQDGGVFYSIFPWAK